MARKTSVKTMLVGTLIGAVLMSVVYLGLEAQASTPNADEINANAIYFTWWYVCGTGVAVLQKTMEGVMKYVPAQQFSFRKLAVAFLFSLPFLLITVFFFMPKYGPPTWNWQKDFLYAFFTSYGIISIGSSLEDYRKFLAYFMERTDKQPK